MAEISIKTAKKVIPMIYAYTTPEIARHNGWTKIGYTEQTVEKRLGQQTHTADVVYHVEWRGNAVFDDGSGQLFKDADFHAYLKKKNVQRQEGTEWFKILGNESHSLFDEFRRSHGILSAINTSIAYKLREEQVKAVKMTVDYFNSHKNGEFLWNAKPRFGKTLSVYDFCKQIDANSVLVVTNRPAIANSWYDDYVKFLGEESDFLFVSGTSALIGKPYVLSREQYLEKIRLSTENKKYRCIEFVSLQDIKGAINFGGHYNKLEEIANINWDVLVVDEAHEGVDTYKTDVAFDHIKRKFTLHLSGTPFKAIASDKFPCEAIYNWTYADEQNAKQNWDKLHPDEDNPYIDLPKLNLFVYQMSEIIKDEIKQGIEIQGETEEFAFNLNDFFETNSSGKFVHDEAVDRFLDALTTQDKYPFSTEKLRNELKHTMWLLDRVDSVKALTKKLEDHPVFGQYKIIPAAGDGRLSEDEEFVKSYDKVKDSIKTYEKTITLTVGQLTTGITIPEWTAVLMLSNVQSPALYMQAAFRAQNPCLSESDGIYYRKENAYVFDFDPARSLDIFEDFANDLDPDTSDGRGSVQKREDNIRNLLNFFPVIGEDENGRMIELDASKVLLIPRKIRSKEVVRRGFMSNYLFQNISRIFNAPKEVIDIVSSFTPVKEPKGVVGIDNNTTDDLSLDENGNVKLDNDYVENEAKNLFGDKIYEDIPNKLAGAINKIKDTEVITEDDTLKKLKEAFKVKMVDQFINSAKTEYGDELKLSEQKRLERKLSTDTEKLINKTYGDYKIQQNLMENERQEKLADAKPSEAKAIEKEFKQKQKQAVEAFKGDLLDKINTFVPTAGQDIVRAVETSRKESEKKTIEDSVKDHLRGFSRTIPSFLMAYGNDKTTLDCFDKIIPNQVFKDVTSITLDQFRFLRDGGSYKDDLTGETKIYEGQLFDKTVFDDSVQEFLSLKNRLADYFDEKNNEDIFDYIPPQKTNQIFTPKKVVKQMVDLLEKENPGCFNDPNKTFIDLYMKSGLYIAEIVKRLFQSNKMKKLYPSDSERLNHIFAKQVYGLAPTEIIYRIAISFVLGFSDKIEIKKNNLKQLDALPYAKEGNLDKVLEKIFQN